MLENPCNQCGDYHPPGQCPTKPGQESVPIPEASSYGSRERKSAKEFNNLESGLAALEQDIIAWENEHPGKRTVILVAGATGSGKSTLAERLQEMSPQQTTVLSLDRYFLDQKDIEVPGKRLNWTIPDVLDKERIQGDVVQITNALIDGQVSVPIYEKGGASNPSKRIGEEPLQIRKRVIVEGAYALSLVSSDTPFLIYLEAPEDVLLRRKIKRDSERLSESTIRERFEANVRPAIGTYVAPQRGNAMYIIRNDR